MSVGCKNGMTSKEVAEQYKRLRAEGMNATRAAKEIGLSAATIGYHVKRNKGLSSHEASGATRVGRPKSKTTVTSTPAMQTFAIPDQIENNMVIVVKGTPSFITETLKGM